MTAFDSGDVVDALAARDPADVRGATLGWARTLVPVWLRGIDEYGRVRDEPDLTARYRTWATGAFDHLGAWHRGERPVVRARVTEIDRAVSALRPGGLFQPAGGRLHAVVCGHTMSVLRTALRMTSGSYAPRQWPNLVAGALVDLAAVRTVFPLSTTDLFTVWTHQAGYDDDAHHAGRARHRPFLEAAPALGLAEPAAAVLAEAGRVWSRFWGEPDPVELDEQVWTAPDLGWNTDLHGALGAALHGGSWPGLRGGGS
ncbi:hypothetical protein ICW40_08435 [Actinotalea ferrariae]|uniref:hypothetical protein n=1 Tax=Actinotalea ferrariae TaxID=1386098 RepID=UPI001C8C12F2|nr:hypothetical protein [Actinotalea ferrariae]MBX9244837.1 hypothetical protein [Actinotalea ferrariae]